MFSNVESTEELIFYIILESNLCKVGRTSSLPQKQVNNVM